MTPKITLACLLLLIAVQERAKNDFPTLRGPYFGQEAPREKAELFMDGVISTEDEPEMNAGFSSDGREFRGALECVQKSVRCL